MQSGKRQPYGLLRAAQSDPKVDRETSGGRGQRPPRRLSGQNRKRHAVREAPARWAVARSAKRPEGVSKYKGCARPARRTPIFARAAKRVVGADGGKRCGWSEPRFLRPLAARNACEVVLRHRFWGAAPNPGRGLRPLHPALDPPAPPSPQFFNAYILKVIRHDLLRRAARLRHAIGAPLAHAHAVAVAGARHDELALLRAQAGDEG